MVDSRIWSVNMKPLLVQLINNILFLIETEKTSSFTLTLAVGLSFFSMRGLIVFSMTQLHIYSNY